MRFLEFNPFASSKVFKFQDPDTGFKFEANDLPTLLARIRGYRSQNELDEIPFLETVVEHHLCTLPENVGACRHKPKLKRDLFSYFKGGVALVRTYMYKSFVSQEEADRRSAICKACTHNELYEKDALAAAADALAIMSIGDRKSKYHEEIGNCGICTCVMRAKVWSGEKFGLSKDQAADMNKVGCWQPAVAKIEE